MVKKQCMNKIVKINIRFKLQCEASNEIFLVRTRKHKNFRILCYVKVPKKS